MQALIGGAANMNNKIDVVELSRELAEIARRSTDPETGRLLMEVIERLLNEAGLPPGRG